MLGSCLSGALLAPYLQAKLELDLSSKPLTDPGCALIKNVYFGIDPRTDSCDFSNRGYNNHCKAISQAQTQLFSENRKMQTISNVNYTKCILTRVSQAVSSKLILSCKI